MTEAIGVDDDRIRIRIDKQVSILSLGPATGMMKIARHPDGTLYLNTQSSRGLTKSTDNGQTWIPMLLHFPDVPPNQFPTGFGITHDGRLWVVHQASGANEAQESVSTKCPGLFISRSADSGQTWATTEIDFGSLAPGAPQDAYVIANTAWCYSSFIERPDGTLMSSTSLRYNNWNNWLHADQSRPGIRDVMIRTTDGGKTWGDATVVHQHATETDYAVNPKAPDHILAATRKQRALLPREDQAAVEKETGGQGLYPWKGGLLLESTDGGRSFREVPNSYTGFYGHRTAITWTEENIVLFAHNAGPSTPAPTVYTRISLDGEQTWADGTQNGTPDMNKSEKFSEIPGRATIEVAPSQFVTAYCEFSPTSDKKGHAIKGIFWHLEKVSQ